LTIIHHQSFYLLPVITVLFFKRPARFIGTYTYELLSKPGKVLKVLRFGAAVPGDFKDAGECKSFKKG
jgi:hypothetical protein